MKNREFGKEVSQNFCLERATIAPEQGASEDKNFVKMPTMPKTDSSSSLCIYRSMSVFPPTIILRHNRENLKKCSLRGLEGHSDYIFYSYPWIKPQPDLTQYVLLTLDAPLLSPEDGQKGIFLIDGTWRYAQKMEKSLPQPFERRSLPKVKTAYPRRQEDCSDPDVGLASIEALYLAFLILGRDSSGLLNNYYWKEEFLFNISNSKLTLPFADKLK